MFAFAASMKRRAAGAELRVVADVAVDDDHLLVGDVFVLELGPALALLARDRLVLAVGLVGDDEGRGLRAARTSVWTLRFPKRVPRALGIRGELLELLASLDCRTCRPRQAAGRASSPRAGAYPGAILQHASSRAQWRDATRPPPQKGPPLAASPLGRCGDRALPVDGLRRRRVSRASMSPTTGTSPRRVSTRSRR